MQFLKKFTIFSESFPQNFNQKLNSNSSQHISFSFNIFVIFLKIFTKFYSKSWYVLLKISSTLIVRKLFHFPQVFLIIYLKSR